MFSTAYASSAIQCTQQGTFVQHCSFVLPKYDIEQAQWIRHWAMTSEPGKPQLPQTGFLIHLPNEKANYSINIVEIQKKQQFLDDIQPAPTIHNQKFVYQKNPSIYGSDAYYPSKVIHQGPKIKWRGDPVVRILISPFQWNPSQQRLNIVQYMTFSIQFFDADKQSTQKAFSSDLKPQGMMNDSLANGQSSQKEKSASWTDKLNLRVLRDGLYCLSYDDLRNHGFPLTCPLAHFQLWCKETQIPLEIQSQSTYLESDDRICFYGQSLNNAYTKANVYQLCCGSTSGIRMPERQSFVNLSQGWASYTYYPIEYETNKSKHFWPSTPNAPDQDFIFWELLNAPDSFFTLFDLPGLYDAGLFAQIEISFQEKTNTIHDLRVYINDQSVFHQQSDQSSHFQLNFEVSTDLLKSNANTLTITSDLSPNEWLDMLYINKLSVRYPKQLEAKNDTAKLTPQTNINLSISGFVDPDIHIYDISNPNSPTKLTDTLTYSVDQRYTVRFYNQFSTRLYVCTNSVITIPEIQTTHQDQLTSQSNCADYIIIVPDDLMPATLPLINFNREQGLKTMTVSPEAIYDIFNSGIIHPQAIHSFLFHAYHHWKSPQPKYVLLVGDSNMDYHDYFQTGKKNQVPAYLTYRDDIGMTPSDNQFVCVDGDDIIPDMIIGRIPGNDVSDIESIINKRLAYSGLSKTTRQRNLFISDNHNQGLFSKVNETSMQYLSNQMEQVHLKITPQTNIPSFTDQIISYLSQGTLIATYTGHGSIDNWSGKLIFTSENVKEIASDSQLTFYISLNCMTGFFAHPQKYSLSQNFILPPNKGAIAVFAPTAMAQTWEVDLLGQSIFSLIRSNPNLPIGDIVVAAKIEAYAKGMRGETLDMFTLTGDPAVKLNIHFSNMSGDLDQNYKIDMRDVLLMFEHLGKPKK